MLSADAAIRRIHGLCKHHILRVGIVKEVFIEVGVGHQRPNAKARCQPRQTMVLAEASREGYQELGRVDPKVDFERPQQPTLANGRLYLRGMDTVVCYRIAP